MMSEAEPLSFGELSSTMLSTSRHKLWERGSCAKRG